MEVVADTNQNLLLDLLPIEEAVTASSFAIIIQCYSSKMVIDMISDAATNWFDSKFIS